jgi:hypothetical protein
MKFFHCETAALVSATVIDGDQKDSKAMILKIRRPTLFSFKAGQFAYIQLEEVNNQWHPFSIMSSPSDSDHLEFFVGVVGNEKSWTRKVYEAIQKNEGTIVQFSVQGPYGESLGSSEKYSHVLAIGSGTGFVPVLSLLKSHVDRLIRLDPKTHIDTLEENVDKVSKHEAAARVYKGSLGGKVTTGLYLRKKAQPAKTGTNIAIRSAVASGNANDQIPIGRLLKMKMLATQASKSLYGTIFLSFLPVFGIALIGYTISYNTIPDPIHFVPWSLPAMRNSAMVGTAIFHGIFALIATCLWNANSFATFIDAVLIMIAPLADWLWFLRLQREGYLRATDLLLYTILNFYFIGRLWYAIVKPRKSSWKVATHVDGVSALARLDAIWIVRSAAFVSQLLPEINESYNQLVSKWGQEYADRVVRVQIHVTDKNTERVETLKTEIAETALFRAGCLYFGRPDLGSIVENHSLELISSHSSSYSLLSFCGSVEMSTELQGVKVTTDMLKTIAGHGTNHQMEYESECRAGARKRKTKEHNVGEASEKVEKVDASASTTSEGQTDDSITETLTRRSTVKLLDILDIDTNTVQKV